MDGIRPEIRQLFAAKEARRRVLAALPFPAKVAVVMKLQEMATPLLRTRGRSVRTWQIEEIQP